MLREVDEGGCHTLVFRSKGRSDVRILNLDEWRADRSHENPFTTLMFLVRQLVVFAMAAREYPSITCELNRCLIDELRIGKRWREAAPAAHELNRRTHRLYKWSFPEKDESLELVLVKDYSPLAGESHDKFLSVYSKYLTAKHRSLELAELFTMPVWHYMPDDRALPFSYFVDLRTLTKSDRKDQEQDGLSRKKRGRKPSPEKQRATAMVAELEARHSFEEIAKIIKDKLGFKYSPETLRTYGSRFRNGKKPGKDATM